MSSSEEKFQEIIDAEEKIEPTDWMPEGYRKNLRTRPVTGSTCTRRPRPSG